jgi:DNA-binding NtrC family response regulator
VTSKEGQGTTLTVLFPAIETSLPLVKKTARSVSKWKASGTVLLVDDEETVRTMGRRMLRLLGFEVVTANDGREAVQIFRREPESIVCVLLDLTMPHMGGEQCFSELKGIRRDVCVLLSSGYPEQELISQFEGQGLAGFIQKPYVLETLMEKMKRALETTAH